MYREHDAEASFWADQQAPQGVPSSETQVKRGDWIVGIDTELIEMLGGNDPCPVRFRAAVSGVAAGRTADMTTPMATTTWGIDLPTAPRPRQPSTSRQPW